WHEEHQCTRQCEDGHPAGCRHAESQTYRAPSLSPGIGIPARGFGEVTRQVRIPCHGSSAPLAGVPSRLETEVGALMRFSRPSQSTRVRWAVHAQVRRTKTMRMDFISRT